MRPGPSGGVNSSGSMPSLRTRHSSASALPVVSAMRGMSPSDCRAGSFRVPSGTGVSAHADTLSSVNWRRHLPIWMTSGTSLPVGGFTSVECPAVSVIADATGDPLTSHAQVAPALIGSSGALGTYTMALYSGSAPDGAYTVPEIVVCPPPGHALGAGSQLSPEQGG